MLRHKLFWSILYLSIFTSTIAQEQSSAQVKNKTAFFEAILAADIASVKSFPLQFANTIDSTGFYPLSLAIRGKEPKLVEVLLDMGANPNLTNEDNLKTTALMQCSNVNDVPMAKLLIQAGANVDTTDKNGDPAIHWAAYFGQEALTQLLLDYKARTDIVSIHSHGVLQVALKGWKSNIVELLLKNGIGLVNVGESDQKIVNAVKSKDSIYFEKHITRANTNIVDASGTPILVTAAELGHLEMVKTLICNGADIDKMNPTGHTALNRAIFFEKPKVSNYLLEQGADINKTDERFILPPLVSAAIKNDASIGLKLINKGAKIDVVDKINTFSPLIWGVVYGSKAFVEMIMKHKPNLDIETTYGTKVKEMTQDPEMLKLLESN